MSLCVQIYPPQVNLTSVEALQGLLKTFQTSLPPSHYLIVIIKRYIQVMRLMPFDTGC